MIEARKLPELLKRVLVAAGITAVFSFPLMLEKIMPSSYWYAFLLPSGLASGSLLFASTGIMVVYLNRLYASASPQFHVQLVFVFNALGQWLSWGVSSLAIIPNQTQGDLYLICVLAGVAVIGLPLLFQICYPPDESNNDSSNSSTSGDDGSEVSLRDNNDRHHRNDNDEGRALCKAIAVLMLFLFGFYSTVEPELEGRTAIIILYRFPCMIPSSEYCSYTSLSHFTLQSNYLLSFMIPGAMWFVGNGIILSAAKAFASRRRELFAAPVTVGIAMLLFLWVNVGNIIAWKRLILYSLSVCCVSLCRCSLYSELITTRLLFKNGSRNSLRPLVFIFAEWLGNMCRKYFSYPPSTPPSSSYLLDFCVVVVFSACFLIISACSTDLASYQPLSTELDEVQETPTNSQAGEETQ